MGVFHEDGDFVLVESLLDGKGFQGDGLRVMTQSTTKKEGMLTGPVLFYCETV